MSVKHSQKDIIRILESPSPISEIEKAKDEFFPFIDRYMAGCKHLVFHYEGDVWEHTKLVVQGITQQEHDWIDILAALLHDVGKKDALARNVKNMHGHELDSERIAATWLAETSIEKDTRKTILWLVRNHMKALDLRVMRSKYDIWKLVKHPLFRRLEKLASADLHGTLNENGIPLENFHDILMRPIVSECIENEMPLPLVERSDFTNQKWNEEKISLAIEMCHRMQINGKLNNRESLIRAAIRNLNDSSF